MGKSQKQTEKTKAEPRSVPSDTRKRTADDTLAWMQEEILRIEHQINRMLNELWELRREFATHMSPEKGWEKKIQDRDSVKIEGDYQSKSVLEELQGAADHSGEETETKAEERAVRASRRFKEKFKPIVTPQLPEDLAEHHDKYLETEEDESR